MHGHMNVKHNFIIYIYILFINLCWTINLYILFIIENILDASPEKKGRCKIY